MSNVDTNDNVWYVRITEEEGPGLKSWLTKLVLIAVVAVLALVVLETLLLVFNDYVFHSSFYVFDPDLGFRVRPYTSFGDDRTNEFGFNDRDYPHSRKPNTFRMVFLGDSFNWMGGLEKNYVSLVERKLEAEFGPDRVEVINAGYSQTHTGEQRGLLEKFGLQYNPDMVVLSCFAGNDFFDADPRRRRIAVGGGMIDVFADKDLYFVVFGQPVVFQSRLVLYLKEKMRSLSRHPLKIKNSRRSRDGSGNLQLSSSNQRLLSDYYLNSLFLRTQFNRHDRMKEYDGHVKLISESVLAMQALCKEHSSEFAVAVFPDEIQVDAEVRAAFLSHYGLDPGGFDWNRAQSILGKLCEERGITFFDLSPTFLEATRAGQRCYLPNNGHWNDSGNELAARFFSTVLRTRIQAGLDT